MTKALEAFRTISEVADELDVQKHVLRFWENKFPQIRPMKRGGGRRYYRPDDMDLLRGIRFLLHREGYTIKGVQKLLREQGLDYVKSCWKIPTAAAVLEPNSASEKQGRKQRPPLEKSQEPAQSTLAGAAAAKAASMLVPAAAANSRREHLAQLKSLVVELEQCRLILNRSKGAAEAGIRPQRAVK